MAFLVALMGYSLMLVVMSFVVVSFLVAYCSVDAMEVRSHRHGSLLLLLGWLWASLFSLVYMLEEILNGGDDGGFH